MTPLDPLDTVVDALRREGWRERAMPGYAGLIGPTWAQEDATWADGLLATSACVARSAPTGRTP